MLDFLRTDTFLIFILIINIILFIIVIASAIKIKKISKHSTEFMRKLGNGKDIREDLEKYVDRVADLESGLSETNVYCKGLEKQLNTCIQKIGIVRYNAYKDTGSDLSFTVALLDEKDNGVVFNGIYSREMSNIYAKPVIGGKSNYTMTEEENEAVVRAINDKGIRRIK